MGKKNDNIVRLTKSPIDNRKSPLTEDIKDDIVSALACGVALSVAAEHAGVTVWQIYQWLDLGEEESPGDLHYEFRRAVQRARSRLEMKHSAVIQKAGVESGDWRASLAFLKHRFPERWSETSKVEHQLTIGKQVTVEDIESWPPAKRRALFNMLRAAKMAMEGEQLPLDRNGNLSAKPFNKALPPGVDPDQVIEADFLE